jgi:hypothetical protein
MSCKFQLHIPEPCHEKWDEMTPAEKGRFCSSCQKVVVDFTRMSDRELAQFFRKTSGPVCGRLTDDQVARDIVVPKKRIPWVRYFLQVMIPAFLFSLKSSAQARVGSKSVKVHTAAKRTVIKEEVLESSTVGGDKLLAEVPKPVDTILSCKPPDPYGVYDMLQGRVGCIILVRDNRKAGPRMKIAAKKIEPAAGLGIFPNPAIAASTITVEWGRSEAGTLNVTLTSAAGQQVYAADRVLQKGESKFNITLPQVTPGVYILSVSNAKTGVRTSGEIIIQ